MGQLARRNAQDTRLMKETRVRAPRLRQEGDYEADDLIQELILPHPADLDLDGPVVCRWPYGVIPDSEVVC